MKTLNTKRHNVRKGEDKHMNRHAKAASRLIIIGAIWYFLGAVFLFTIGMITPIDININGVHTRAYLWEFTTYPGPLSLWVAFIAIPFILAVTGLTIRKRLKEHATTAQGVFLLVSGLVTFLTGAGILYIIAGVKTLLARENTIQFQQEQS